MGEPSRDGCEKGHYRTRRPSYIWSHTDRLQLDEDGRLWTRGGDEDDEVYLGRIEEEPDVDAGLEPQRDELLDRWLDAGSREDLRAEWRADYYAGLF